MEYTKTYNELKSFCFTHFLKMALYKRRLEKCIGSQKDVWKNVYLQKRSDMRRAKIDELIAWKNSPSRKPLIIRGARQVG